MAKVFTITEGLENMGALKTGGQGSVYKGRRTGQILTAIKILPTPIHSETVADRNYNAFINEVTKLKRVNEKPNPHVVKILSSGITESGSLPFIEMDFIEGPDLEELLKPPHDPVFTIKEALKVADQLSSALAHCHQFEVKHGDIKTNNVKLNTHTGTYILLDFGLAVMSDEQRRTSLRHAGAIEFMAPEQNEGRMLYETDVYSFGIILFELLAGQVPFPLMDSGETSRNRVMVSHLETPPPDLVELRRQHLPANWAEVRKEQEMHVPDWLVTAIYKCLEKKPSDRFANGMALHDFIVTSSIRSNRSMEASGARMRQLEEDNRRLQREKEQLQQELIRLQQAPPPPPMPPRQSISSYEHYQTPRRGKNTPVLLYALLLVVLLGIGYVAVNSFFKKGDQQQEAQDTPRRSIGQYKVQAARAYFHDEADASTRRTAYMIPSNDVVTALEDKNGFIYTEFTNGRGQTSKGWLKKADLVPLGEWKEPEVQQPRLTPADIRQQLGEARTLLERNQFKEALYIYSFLAEQQVPEALYEYGNLALQKKNEALSCGEAYQMVVKASDKGYAPAKRTLGFLYIFADNPDILRLNEYENCSYERNVFKGTKLLTQATFAGDSTARRLLDELRLRENQQPAPDTTTVTPPEQ